LNKGRRPAACQVDPLVSSLRSIRTTSDQPFFARWYKVLTPTAPPPIITTLAWLFIFLPFASLVTENDRIEMF
jgi:hypothetical protein